jgi:hypothetical protein
MAGIPSFAERVLKLFAKTRIAASLVEVDVEATDAFDSCTLMKFMFSSKTGIKSPFSSMKVFRREFPLSP